MILYMICKHGADVQVDWQHCKNFISYYCFQIKNFWSYQALNMLKDSCLPDYEIWTILVRWNSGYSSECLFSVSQLVVYAFLCVFLWGRGWVSRLPNIQWEYITAQVKTEGIIQITFEFQGTNFGGYLASELNFMGSITYFDKHSHCTQCVNQSLQDRV